MEEQAVMGTFQNHNGTVTWEEEIGSIELHGGEGAVYASGLIEIEIDGHTFVREDVALQRHVDEQNRRVLASIQKYVDGEINDKEI